MRNVAVQRKSGVLDPGSHHSQYETDRAKEDEKEFKEPPKSLHRGVIWGSMSVFISVLGSAAMHPFLQAQRDKLECDALCYGNIQSARSGLGIVGSAFVGRISDRFGRTSALWIGICASLTSFVINYNTSSIEGMWFALIPSALLNQNYTVLKALFADYTTEMGGVESDRASMMGKLGMAVRAIYDRVNFKGLYPYNIVIMLNAARCTQKAY